MTHTVFGQQLLSVERYAGDATHKIYLFYIGGSYHLGLIVDGQLYARHLTSEPDYYLWLIKHDYALLTLPKDLWLDARPFGCTKQEMFYDEFHYTLNEIKQQSRNL